MRYRWIPALLAALAITASAWGQPETEGTAGGAAAEGDKPATASQMEGSGSDAAAESDTPATEPKMEGSGGAPGAEGEPVEYDLGSFETKEHLISYCMGMSFAKQLGQMAMDIEADSLLKGIGDVLGDGEPLLTEDEFKATITTYMREMRTKQMADMKAGHEKRENMKAEETTKAPSQKPSKTKEAGEAFLAENAKKEGVTVLPSGLQYRVITAGDGAKPTRAEKVKVHYRGTLIDGTEFDSSYKKDRPAQFGVGQVIAGWTEALLLMPVGSKWELAIPSDLAYGSRGVGDRIGPDSVLVFEVELLEVVN